MTVAIAIPQELLDQLTAAQARLEQHRADEEIEARLTKMFSIGRGEEPVTVKRGPRSQASIDKGKATMARNKAEAEAKAAAAAVAASKPKASK